MKKCTWFLALILVIAGSALADPSISPSARAPEGYSGGWYERVTCVVDCPPGAIREGEPDCYDGYRDSTNTGCNCGDWDPPTICTFSQIACGDTVCGTSGNFDVYYATGAPPAHFRDTDWYRIVLTSPATITWSAVAEFPVLLFILSAGTVNCYDSAWAATGGPCDTVVLTSRCLPAGEYYLWIGAQVFDGVPCGSDYVAWVNCEACCLPTSVVRLDAGQIPQCECVHLCPGATVPIRVCGSAADPGRPPILIVMPGCYTPDLGDGHCAEPCDPIPSTALYYNPAGWTWDESLHCWVNSVTGYAEGCACVCLEGFLAVELQSFTAHGGDGRVTLNWQTASERENDHFEVMRDGHLAVTNVRATNNPTGAHYSWTDRDLQNGRTYTYELVAVDVSGIRTTLATTEATPAGSTAEVISEYALRQNYPNPFNPRTSISFDLVESGFVKLTVYNPMGQQVAAVVSGEMPAGTHTITFDAANLPSGMYLYRLEVNGFSAVRKMLLMK